MTEEIKFISPNFVGPAFFTMQNEDGTWNIRIVPSPFWNVSEKNTTLTSEEYDRFIDYVSNNKYLHEVFPEWSPEKRELFISGMNDEEFSKIMD